MYCKYSPSLGLGYLFSQRFIYLLKNQSYNKVGRDREKGLPLPLVHPPMAAAAGTLRLAHRADPIAGARYLSWSPMGCRAQVLGPSSTALPGHSRELAWKRGNQDRIRHPDRD